MYGTIGSVCLLRVSAGPVVVLVLVPVPFPRAYPGDSLMGSLWTAAQKRWPLL